MRAPLIAFRKLKFKWNFAHDSLKPCAAPPLLIFVSRNDTYLIMIQNTVGKRAAQAVANTYGKGFPAELVKRTRALLTALDAATQLEDLRFPPGNHLEKLTGDRDGQHSIRINRQWRICFVWTDAGPADVEITDYH